MCYGRSLEALVDTGASRTLMDYEVFKELCQRRGRTAVLTPSEPLATLTGQPLSVKGRTEIVTDEGICLRVIVVQTLPHALIIGIDTLARSRGVVDVARGRCELNGQEFACLVKPESSGPNLAVVMDSGNERINALLHEYKDVFHQPGCAVGVTSAIAPMRIITTGKPIAQRPYRAPLTKRHVIEEEITEMLRDGVIEPSQSPWASPVLLVPKRDGSTRFCVDYRRLNAVTVRDQYPLPQIQDIFDAMGGSSIFSTLDLKSGYWQIPVDERDKEKTAFTCHRGHFQFNRVSFGLTNAPAVFQRAMDGILSPVLGHCALVYIDDIVVYSKDAEEHERHLHEVFTLLQNAGLRLKSSKCEFARPSVELLGYIISADGITPTPEKTSAIRELPPPRNIKTLRSFLGLANYYRQCMKDYGRLAEPLIELTRKGTVFQWTQERQTSFDALKALLVSPAVMAYPDVQKPYRLYTDACAYAVGAVLVQTDNAGVERVVQYISHQLSSVQRRWATIEKEAFAVVYAITKLRPYLYGAEFVVLTDHKPLKSLFSSEMQNTKIQRWAVLLAEYGATIQYREGKNNIRADMLSRIMSEEAPDEVALITDNTSQETGLDAGDDYDVLREDGIDHTMLAAEQRNEFADEITEAADDNEDSDYIVQNGILYSERRPYPEAEAYPRIMLPEKWRATVIDRAHRDVGHMAAAKTQKRVTEAYVWPGLRKAIRARLVLCALCQSYHRRPVHVRMQDIDTPATPMEFIGMDLVGPFPRTAEGFRYILTMIDYMSGWAEAFPVRDQSAAELIRVMTHEYLPRHGHPKTIVCDNGQGFGSRAWTALLKEAGVRLIHSTPQHPQGNGKVERFNRTFKEILNKLIMNRPANWIDQIGAVLSAYRHSVSSVTGHTPFYLLYGRRARVPLERYLGPDQNFGGRLTDLVDAYKDAAQRTIESRRYNRNRLDARANVQTSLEVGDTVMMKAEERVAQTSRWDPQWEVYRVHGTTHWVRHQPSGKTKKVHREKLTLVDPTVVWDGLPARPRRQFRPRN